jgi:hypothetical protein
MSAKSTQTSTSRNDDVEARISLLEYQFASQTKALERIEAKQDAAIRQIDTLKYVAQHEYDGFASSTDRRLNSLEGIKPRIVLIEKVVYGFIGLTLVLVLTAVITGVLKR